MKCALILRKASNRYQRSSLSIPYEDPKKRNKIILSFIASTLFIACNQYPGQLIGNLNAYSSIEKTFSDLGLDSASIDTIENSKLKDGDRRPPFNIYTVEFPHTDLGVNGRLRISFYNGLLTASIFYPENWDRYLNALDKEREINLNGIEETSKGGARVWKSTDHKGRKYIGWEDKVLDKEKQRWIRRYS